MRLLLLAVVLICPLALLSPSFSGLYGMVFTATPVTSVEPDGSHRLASIGPASPWPAWVVAPEHSRLTVTSWTAASATMAAHGQGVLGPAGIDAREAMVAYRQTLMRAGWAAESWLYRGVEPRMPPRLGETCTLVATDPVSDRTLYAWLDVSHNTGGAIGWYDGKPPQTAGGKPHGAIVGGC